MQQKSRKYSMTFRRAMAIFFASSPQFVVKPALWNDAEKIGKSPMSRRKFLRRTATAGRRGGSSPTIIPASALGRNGLVAPSE